MNFEKIKNKIGLEKKEDEAISEAVEIDSVQRKKVIMSAYDEIKNTKPENIISYGYDWLDEKLSGIFPGQLILIGGESGTGKTLFTSGIIYKCKKPTAIFSLEERLEDFGKKALYFEIGKVRKQENKKQYPWKEFVRGELNKNQNFEKDVAKAYENLGTEYPLFQKMEKMATIDTIEQRIKILAWQGVKLILIDHLHSFDLLSDKTSKADYIEQVMTRLRLIAIKHKVSIIIVAHYRKLNGNKPTLDSFKDSISIVQNASVVINIWRNREEGITEADKYKTQFIIPKSRDLGGEGKIDVIFNPNTGEYDKNEGWAVGVPTKENNYNLEKLDL